MARFFFDLVDNGTSYPDTEGTDLTTLASAEDEAARALLEIAKDQMPNGTFRQVALQVHAGTTAPLFVVKATLELIRNEPYPDQQVGA
ncbi:hypothetical protein LB559_05600 [Mesorhizobium sp. BR1-1-3]|uniref:DUF6894 family protein n=1 Tax=Mesorhizobium sp. BR1-1-3 TaxID=2876651 RepID=UPI001CD0CDCF|nr:hypothetical protein [Mesorhizobium sp. BR1-1-3]MBZ9887418.1 hypothetical protein [Mesorhizobium sp. BR1-1-3]